MTPFAAVGDGPEVGEHCFSSGTEPDTAVFDRPWWAGRRGLRTDTPGNGRDGRTSVRARARSVMSVAAPVIDYRHGFQFDLSPEQLWERIEEVDQYERWWPWLSECELEGSGLTQGSVLRGVVSPPLPYRMRLRVELGECVRPHSIDATVGGDLTGVAGLGLRPREGGTWAEVWWHVEMLQPAMRLASRFGHPLLQWGHDRVVEITVAGFRRRLKAAGT